MVGAGAVLRIWRWLFQGQGGDVDVFGLCEPLRNLGSEDTATRGAQCPEPGVMGLGPVGDLFYDVLCLKHFKTSFSPIKLRWNW